MGPKTQEPEMQEEENYIPAIQEAPSQINDASELISHIRRVKQMIQSGTDGNEIAVKDLEIAKSLHELDLEHWRKLILKRENFYTENKLQKYSNDAELRDREEKIRNVQYERACSLGLLWKRFYQKSRRKYFNGDKVKVMELLDMLDRKNKLIEINSLNEDAIHYKLSYKMTSSGNEDFQGQFDRYNEQRFYTIAKKVDICENNDEGFQSRAPNCASVNDNKTDFELLKNQLMTLEFEKINAQADFVDSLVQENVVQIEFLQNELRKMQPAKLKKRTKEKPPVIQIDARGRFLEELKKERQYNALKRDIGTLHTTLIILEHLEDVLSARI